MTYSIGDVFDINATKKKIDIPDIPASEIGSEFVLIIRNLHPTLSVDVWTLGGIEVKHRIPPNFDGVVVEHLAWEHIRNGLLGQVTTAGTAQLNIVLYSRRTESILSAGFGPQTSSAPVVVTESGLPEEDEREVVSVTV